jgi:hypothetical protein
VPLGRSRPDGADALLRELELPDWAYHASELESSSTSPRPRSRTATTGWSKSICSSRHPATSRRGGSPVPLSICELITRSSSSRRSTPPRRRRPLARTRASPNRCPSACMARFVRGSLGANVLSRRYMGKVDAASRGGTRKIAGCKDSYPVLCGDCTGSKKRLVHQTMEEGAFGVSSALVYAPRV